MITTALIIYLGVLVSAPSWFFWVAGVAEFLSIVNWGLNLYKKGKGDR